VALVLAAVLAACGPPPAPAPLTVPAPPPAASPGDCGAAAAQAMGVDEESPTAVAGEPTVVVVALDDEGRPEIVTTELRDTAATTAELEADPGLDVVAVEADRPVSIADTGGDPLRPQQWALDALQIESAWSAGTGVDVDIAVVDSGVSGDHPDLAPRVCSGVAFLASDGVARLGQGATDGNGHGTHVAGIAAAGTGDRTGTAGVAPSARIMPVRVLGADGTGSSSDVARGITWAVDHGAEVINVSLGGGYSSAVDVAVDYAERQGVLVVAASGNAGPNGARNYPAALDDVLAVASHDQGGAISSFSTQGDYVDLSAPGSGIVSTYPDGRWASMSGTSMATPHVAGAAALLLAAQPELTPAQLRARLRATATDAGVPGFDVAHGWGRLDLLDALAG
jgi:subtilisin family serine protease